MKKLSGSSVSASGAHWPDSSFISAWAMAKAENKAGHKKFDTYNLPEWVRHPLISQPKKVAILFPGEGNAVVGMCRDAKKSKKVQEMLETATRVFGFDVGSMMASGPADTLNQSGFSGPLMYVANCAAYEVLKEKYPDVAGSPQAVAGVSVGEYSALYVAGVISYETGLSLVKTRTDAMSSFMREEAMDAITIKGVDANKVEGMCNKAMKNDRDASDPQVHIAQISGPDTFVVAGIKSTVAKVEEAAKNDKKVSGVSALKGVGAMHTPVVGKPADTLGAAIDKILPMMKPPRCELYLNATGWRVPPGKSPLSFASAIKEQLTSAVIWEGALDQMMRWGIKSFYECGPGRSIKTLLADVEFVTEAPYSVFKPADAVVNVTV
mmetsp:Transcript_97536/g.178225  ORF Transcript_97536/g.178225 Transcript_97536/m.178225 type:complete len:380 (+) Transcript_97536:1-1140(+)